jgi:hypothetical protein
MTSVWERVQAYCGSMLASRPHASHSAESPFHANERRAGVARVPTRESCEFALTHALDVDRILVEEGAGMTVNVSRSGMQLMLGVAPRIGQLLEVHRGGLLHRSVSLVEVRWTKPVRTEAQGQLHLIGCRLTFGPSRYWAL